MEENVIQKKGEHEDSLSSSEDEIAIPNKVAKPAFSWTKYEKQREFNEEWTNLFMCIETPDKKKAQCLICLQLISQKKKSHLSRHFESQHAKQISNKYPIGSELRTEYIRQLQSQINKQKSCLKAALSDGECVTLASYKISMIIAKHQKPFSDGEFLKKCFFGNWSYNIF